ncbi:uncharacterized protein LOC123559199 isoform X1 [Mercenaria mercenaria]|uniref:uncharacterized protein LOC123559199 isoform X1 n=1 Tax=Mercenaria mercenaria TaxID=6596 RepID=UPI001E1DBCDF|nr:uncharacterized protein LOC123559199 isoform X1 [Mercenaria mercenaria]
MELVIFSYVLFHFCAVAYGLKQSFAYELYSKNEIKGNVIFHFDTNSVQACVALCDDTYGCLSVNFHKENGKCKLTDYYPLDETKSGKPEKGWKIFFRRNFDKDLLKEATAWQSSTYTHWQSSLTADKAIDGNTDSNLDGQSCSHTDNLFSYWAVEFGTSGPVKEVEICLRNDACRRNTNFRVTVSDSRDDVINDGGKLCGTYFGPQVDKDPFRLTITCSNTLYGKFLKIKHEMEDLMTLCEVFVYTP